ncbi:MULTISPECIES: cellulase [Streptomyces]|uniref:Cellulase n=1 Tax=Streptomyces edwardsiae TaxID=3075527 RepID=A0ABU2PWY7_9ACTN|nr:cellulase [Streptomyces sp. DSM 41636]MDT0396655.1 cellulase [Streptomyces sp. DSM 41636]
MDDFEHELTRMMRDSRQPDPFRAEQRERLYEGIRVRRRSRVLWRAGGSALAVAGLSVVLALLPGTDSRSAPADRGPLPTTGPTAGPTPPPVRPSPTTAPSTSKPPAGPTSTTSAGTPGYAPTPTSRPPDASMSTTSAPPPTQPARGPSPSFTEDGSD